MCFGLINHCGGLGVEELVQFVKYSIVTMLARCTRCVGQVSQCVGRASFVDGLRDVVLWEEHHFLKVLGCDC